MFRLKQVPSSSDPHDQSLTVTEELYWIAHRSRTNGGEPEDVPRRWRDIQGDERRAIMPIYEAWLKGFDAPEVGTPLARWIDSPLVEPMVRAGITTVEQLAASAQSVVAGCGMGCLAIQKKAQDYVRDQEANKSVNADLAATRAQLAELQAQVAKLTGLTEDEKSALAPKPKRPYTRREKTEGAAQAMTG